MKKYFFILVLFFCACSSENEKKVDNIKLLNKNKFELKIDSLEQEYFKKVNESYKKLQWF